MAAKDNKGAGKGKQIAAGVAIGIGSSAIVAALLYANRPRKPETPPAPKPDPAAEPRFEPRES